MQLLSSDIYFSGSDFKTFHSSESVLLKVYNNLLLATDSIFMLLNLTAALDTVDHIIIISCLELCVNIKGIGVV